MTSISRRSLLALTSAALAAGIALPALGLDVITYTPETLEAARASGKPFLIDFYASWCTTCKAQERVLEELRAENSDYQAITIVRVDWDQHSRGELVAELAIPRRSTLVLMQGETELGRLVADTRKDAIAALLDLARS